ncbi:MAG: hypothetical protein K8R36_11585 [Planctomycetales bacterium]|nr:hypothetical protein [Planctomycetales bacterium]
MSLAEPITTTVLPGQRIEVAVPAFDVGQTVAVTVVPSPAAPKNGKFDLVGFFDALPPGPRTFPTWEEYEQHFQSERDSWDR